MRASLGNSAPQGGGNEGGVKALRDSNLSQLHHHVGKHVQESHHSVPEAAVCQALLVPGAGALGKGWWWLAERAA